MFQNFYLYKMNEQLYRLKSFINVSKLINGLVIPTEATKIRIVFNDEFSVKGRFTKAMNVRILSVKAMNGSTVLKTYDMMEIFEIAEGINVWLNVRKQLNKVNFGLTKKLHCIDIDLQQKTFINQKGETISYYPIQYVSVKEGDESNKVMNRLEKELREKELEYVNNNETSKKIKDSDDNEEIDPEMF